MRVDHSNGGVEAGIRDAPHADAAVVIGDILHKPVDRVIRVTTLVDIRGFGLVIILRPHIHVSAFGHPRAANIGIYNDVTLLAKSGEGPIESL